LSIQSIEMFEVTCKLSFLAFIEGTKMIFEVS